MSVVVLSSGMKRPVLRSEQAVQTPGAQASIAAMLAPEEVRAGRLELCRACNRYTPADDRCVICGVCGSGVMTVRVKWAHAYCPEKPAKWGRWKQNQQ